MKHNILKVDNTYDQKNEIKKSYLWKYLDQIPFAKFQNGEIHFILRLTFFKPMFNLIFLKCVWNDNINFDMKKDVNMNIIWTNLKVKLIHLVLKHIRNTQKNGYKSWV